MKDFGEVSAVEVEFKKEEEQYNEKLDSYLAKLRELNESENQTNKAIENTQNKKEKRKLESRLNDIKKSQENEVKEYKEAKKDFDKFKTKYREKRLMFWESRKRRNLVYIGRGWVKAGINLKDISENDIILDEDDSSSIQILISDPVILDADINPWFIYTDEKKVKGFEVFFEKTGSIFSEANFTDREVTELKKKCKEKLRTDAIEKGLLKNAESSAIRTLENFFHLVGFKKVDIRFRSKTIVVSKE
jgi:hypothetical protein